MLDVANSDRRISLALQFNVAHSSFLDVCKSGTPEEVVTAGDGLHELFNHIRNSGLFSPEAMLPFHSTMEGVGLIMTLSKDAGEDEVAYYKRVAQTLSDEAPKI